MIIIGRVKRVPLSASIPENHDEITYFRILGRITRCSSYHLCYLSGSGGRRRFEPHFQHCILYYHCLIGRTGNNHFFRRPDFESFQTAGKTGNDFGVELPEEIDSDLSDMTITKSMLEEADTLKDMNLPKGTLVMIVKRGDEFLIPNGTLKLHEGDKLLLISEKSKEEDTDSE